MTNSIYTTIMIDTDNLPYGNSHRHPRTGRMIYSLDFVGRYSSPNSAHIQFCDSMTEDEIRAYLDVLIVEATSLRDAVDAEIADQLKDAS